MSTPRLQREFDRLYPRGRIMDDNEIEALFEGAPPPKRPAPLPTGFWICVGLLALVALAPVAGYLVTQYVAFAP